MKKQFEKVTVNNHYLRKMQGFQMLSVSQKEDDSKHWKNIMFWEKMQNNVDFPEYTYLRMIELATIIKGLSPNVIIELGAGLSTNVFSNLGIDKHVVIEESKAWVDKIKDHYIENLDTKKTEIIQADVKVDHKSLGCRYDVDWKELFKKHNINHNHRVLVYVDGANSIFQGKEYVCTDSTDIIDESEILIDYFVFNQKSPSVMNLLFNFPTSYIHHESVWLNPGVSKHHDIFELI